MGRCRSPEFADIRYFVGILVGIAIGGEPTLLSDTTCKRRPKNLANSRSCRTEAACSFGCSPTAPDYCDSLTASLASKSCWPLAPTLAFLWPKPASRGRRQNGCSGQVSIRQRQKKKPSTLPHHPKTTFREMGEEYLAKKSRPQKEGGQERASSTIKKLEWMLSIKLHKAQLASDRTSCRDPKANQFRLILHTAAYWLMLALRKAVPKRSALFRAEYATLRLRLLKIATRVVEGVARICVSLPSACPDVVLFRHLAGHFAAAGP
jgi:hypothetical protein